ncbi:MAG TPA: chemotaxis protein CheD [Atribacteraceae bacterium]|nr:chemotaxis protein CheD [Atribacteraceae bacterium]
MGQKYSIGMAEFRVSDKPEDRLCIMGLGSCVGACLYDRENCVAGMAHILLPQSIPGQKNIFKFADTAVEALLEEMAKVGARKKNVIAKIAGGAKMFAGTDSLFDIGKRNVEAVKQVVQDLGIPLLGENTGGNRGRSITFHVQNGRLEVKTIGQECFVI